MALPTTPVAIGDLVTLDAPGVTPLAPGRVLDIVDDYASVQWAREDLYDPLVLVAHLRPAGDYRPNARHHNPKLASVPAPEGLPYTRLPTDGGDHTWMQGMFASPADHLACTILLRTGITLRLVTPVQDLTSMLLRDHYGQPFHAISILMAASFNYSARDVERSAAYDPLEALLAILRRVPNATEVWPGLSPLGDAIGHGAEPVQRAHSYSGLRAIASTDHSIRRGSYRSHGLLVAGDPATALVAHHLLRTQYNGARDMGHVACNCRKTPANDIATLARLLIAGYGGVHPAVLEQMAEGLL